MDLYINKIKKIIFKRRYYSEMKKCDKGYKTGECCCNCQHQMELFKHPWNKKHKGSVLESTKMFACIVQHDVESNGKATLYEDKHGMCEMHKPKQINYDTKRINR